MANWKNPAVALRNHIRGRREETERIADEVERSVASVYFWAAGTTVPHVSVRKKLEHVTGGKVKAWWWLSEAEREAFSSAA